MLVLKYECIVEGSRLANEPIDNVCSKWSVFDQVSGGSSRFDFNTIWNGEKGLYWLVFFYFAWD